jgi:hypothetical protein
LFGFQRPKVKVPISKERILQAKQELEKRDFKSFLKTLRDVRERLEKFERKL